MSASIVLQRQLVEGSKVGELGPTVLLTLHSIAMATTAAPGPPKLVNMYYLRVVGTPKPCMICSKLTTSCLGQFVSRSRRT